MTAGQTRVAVIGAGLMGSAIAQVFAASGSEVALYDPAAAPLAAAPARIGEACRLLGIDEHEVLARVRAEDDLGAAVADASFVIEAGPEKLAVKRETFAQLGRLSGEDAILASNTSSIPIAQLGADVRDKARLVGTHFWNPPYLVPLVEVVQSEGTAEQTVTRAMALLRGAGMEPVHLRADIPGFVGNRLQHALKREAIALLAAGVCDAEAIDTVVKSGFGMRLPYLGPLEQSDMVGLELTLDIHRVLLPALDRSAEPQRLLMEKVAAGETGMAAGAGFRAWSEPEANVVRERVSRELVAAARRRRRFPGAGRPESVEAPR